MAMYLVAKLAIVCVPELASSIMLELRTEVTSLPIQVPHDLPSKGMDDRSGHRALCSRCVSTCIELARLI